MRKWKRQILSITAALLIISCNSSPPVVVPLEKVQHVEWPAALEQCKYSFEFQTVEKKPIVVLSYPDWVSLTKCREKEINYILNLSSMVCYYRADLKESRCITKELIEHE